MAQVASAHKTMLGLVAGLALVIVLFSSGLSSCTAMLSEPLPVKRTVKKYKVFLASSQALLATFYAAKHNSCFSIGVNTPKLRCTLLVL